MEQSVNILCDKCCLDPAIDWVLDADVRCLHCGNYFCTPHILDHMKTVHGKSANFDQCVRLEKDAGD
jgi:hypothetical protein